ncbi:MAG: DUF421 domain-containing protein [Bacillota bacterium]|nr:DUF421 domain-containing protein [Bacillota bacterium]
MSKLLISNLDIIIRSLLSILILFFMTRLMGKKQISQLSFFDYVVGITIGSIAAAFSVDNRIGYTHAIISIILWGVLPIIISYLSLKNIHLRKLLDGTSTILIQNGKIVERNLVKERFHINDLLQELRLKGAFNVSDVEFAILETNGQISIQLKPNKQPITPSILNVFSKYEGMYSNVIIDGQILYSNLKYMNLSEKWLMKELHAQDISSPKDVLLGCVDENMNLYIDLKHNDPEKLKIVE